MAISTGSSTERGTPALGELFLNTETRKLEVGDGSGWWGTGLEEITSQGSGARFPADVPIRDGDKILEIEQPEPATFEHDSLFQVNAGGNGIRFRQPLFSTRGDDTVADDFELGTECTIRFEASSGKVRYRFNGDIAPFTASSSASTCFLKAGNPDSAPGESTSEFSEVEILALTVAHS